MTRGPVLTLCLCLVAATAAAQDPEFVRQWERVQRERPAALSSRGVIAAAGEPGTPLRIRGRVYLPDGRRPAAGVVVFAYQTDRTGRYDTDGGRGWRLRGWVRTDAEGRFELRTIRPGPYPSGGVPAHVHFTVEGPGLPRRWTAELQFSDDAFLTPSQRAASEAAGRFAWIRPVTRGADGSAEVQLDLRAADEGRF